MNPTEVGKPSHIQTKAGLIFTQETQKKSKILKFWPKIT